MLLLHNYTEYYDHLLYYLDLIKHYHKSRVTHDDDDE